mmetsp:Transcript_756/g.1186  ORF Transcript_756/g.1186 Transcript_756/m.1186 type:complete len:325 (-) Transcript_756:619-1593(-)
MIGITTNAFNFFEIACFSCRFNVFEVHFFIFRSVDNLSQIKEQTIIAFELFIHLNQFMWCDLFRIFGRNLNDSLKIAAHIGAQHVFQDLQRVVDRQRAKVRRQELGIRRSSTWCTAFGQHAFDVTGVSVVLQRTLSQTSFLTQFSDAFTIVVRKHFICQNRIGNLWSSFQIDFQHTCLQWPLISTICFECFKQHSCDLRNGVLCQKCINHRVRVDKRTRRVGEQHGGEFDSRIRVGSQHLRQNLRIIRRITNFGGVCNDFVVLSGFSKAQHNFGFSFGTEINRQSKSGVHTFHQITQFFRTFKFVLFQPVLQQFFTALCQYWTN